MAAAPHQAQRAQAGRRRRVDRRRRRRTAGPAGDAASIFGRAFDNAANMAASFFTATPFSGEVNFLTTSALGAGAAALQRLRAARRRLHVDRRARRLGPLGRARLDEPVRRRRRGSSPDRSPRASRRATTTAFGVSYSTQQYQNAHARALGSPPSPTTRATSARSTAAIGGRCRRRSRSTTARATRTTTTCAAARCSARASGFTLTPFDEHARRSPTSRSACWRRARRSSCRADDRRTVAAARAHVRAARGRELPRRARALLRRRPRRTSSTAPTSSACAASSSASTIRLATLFGLPVERRAEVARALLRRERRRGRRAKAGRSR